MTTRYFVWIYDPKDGDKDWVECGEGPLTQKQAERISREIRADCGCRAIARPAGYTPSIRKASGE